MITGLFRSVFNLVGIVIAMLLLNWPLAQSGLRCHAVDDPVDQLLAAARAAGGRATANGCRSSTAI
jgi:hypothetical protein